MSRIQMIGCAALALVIAAGAGAALARFPVEGYLEQATPDTTSVIPPAPEEGSLRDEADRGMFRTTRALKGSSRWEMAINDVEERKIVDGMACALGVQLSPHSAPRLTRLLVRVGPDVSHVTRIPKMGFDRKRPYLRDEGDICVEKTESLAKSPDYPSGHAAWGWTVGLVLAEIAPDRAVPVLQRARAFGESRVVCGVHTPSAVEAGRTNAAALVAILHGSPEFREDLAAARAEFEAVRKTAPAAKACAAEAEILARPAW